MCVCPGAWMISPPSSCRQMTVPETHGSARTSSMVARFLGSISNIRAMICLLSLGSRRSRRQGPLMTSGFLSSEPGATLKLDLTFTTGTGSGSTSLSGLLRSLVDLEGTGVSDNLLISVPGDGGDANNLYELSVIRGIFHGNRRRDMQQKIIARDQISAG